MMNSSDLNNIIKFAVTGENLEIVKLCEKNHLSFEGSCEIAVHFHQNEVFHYIYEGKMKYLVKINSVS